MVLFLSSGDPLLFTPIAMTWDWVEMRGPRGQEILVKGSHVALYYYATHPVTDSVDKEGRTSESVNN